MSKIPVSVCIIAKNEETHIRECLKRLQPYGFEIVVADTGSTDLTRQIALQYADKVIDFAWIDDFSAARNFCAGYAANNYILALDCDEYIEHCNADRIASHLRNNSKLVGVLQIKSVVNRSDGLTSYIKDNVPHPPISVFRSASQSLFLETVRKRSGSMREALT